MATYKQLMLQGKTGWYLMNPRNPWETLKLAWLLWRHPDRVGALVSVDQDYTVDWKKLDKPATACGRTCGSCGSGCQDEQAGEEAQPCPFCNHKIDLTDPDCCHKTAIFWRKEHGLTSYVTKKDYQPGDQPIWTVTCSNSSGGCGAAILGFTREEALKNWNRRAK